jgi:diaminopimelate epimerase
VTVTRGTEAGTPGIWLDLGQPSFGPAAVAARPERVIAGDAPPVVTVPRLAALDPRWARTVFVRIGNPHAVTFLEAEADLPDMAALRAPALHAALTRIAFAAGSEGEGDPCPAGINLQWAAPRADGSLAARVFERGEGPTESSGTSATAVASAALRLGLVAGPRVLVHMPGGTAPLAAAADGTMRLFGTARRLP